MTGSNTKGIYVRTCKEIPFLLLLLEFTFQHQNCDQALEVLTTFGVYTESVGTKRKYFATNLFCY